MSKTFNVRNIRDINAIDLVALLAYKMRDNDILGRRYFYPLISSFSTYRGLPSAAPENLPVATRIANEVICLPMHHELSEDDVDRIIELLRR